MKQVPGADKVVDHCLRNRKTLFMAFKNGGKDRELKGLMDTNAFVSCCPQSHQKFLLDPATATNTVKK